ncbi:hypothetical protein CYME_CML072C [Cyanidioschyzon merolae strain 10D]|jgi:hypothetical protein|uniref:Uncharacterized protein n=1 Tax=Cyanidioschyzon merolae (strain NIES-3377 / 10D) TaxID=280699 RepID=M1USL3_CYAM1|nr:hypothetical protein CYME_CML072C [Cyanidioschyzon merolae strain 10D]BAM80691.1 hypothetical protein CYME_CML072C [Cyanidioschyzon merolae strain 10D]|eukprot:XP_005536727.1 hypothetical protein CYME_CML072C [Cyanidioschyzon merolae strain 10D]
MTTVGARPVLLLELAKYALRSDVEYVLKRYGDVWQKAAVAQIFRGSNRRNSDRARWLVQFRDPEEAARVAQRLLDYQQRGRGSRSSNGGGAAGEQGAQPFGRGRRARSVFSAVSLAPESFLERELHRPALSRVSDVGRAVVCSNLARGVEAADVWRLFVNAYDVEEVRLHDSAAEVEADADTHTEDTSGSTAEQTDAAAQLAAEGTEVADAVPVRKARPLACVVFRSEDDAWRAIVERQGAYVKRRPVELSIVQ